MSGSTNQKQSAGGQINRPNHALSATLRASRSSRPRPPWSMDLLRVERTTVNSNTLDDESTEKPNYLKIPEDLFETPTSSDGLLFIEVLALPLIVWPS